MNQPSTTKAPQKHSAPRSRDRWFWRLRPWLTPGLRNAQYAYFELLEHTLRPGDRWLDLGCGRRLVPDWMTEGGRTETALLERAGQLVGIDPDAQALADNTLAMFKHIGSAESVPEPDASFDLITANMVFEHLDDPGEVLREAARLLRPGGRLILHTPNRWYPAMLAATAVPEPVRRRVTAWLEKRPMHDIYPTRYRMNSSVAIYHFARQSGMQVHRIDRQPDTPETIPLGPLVAVEMLFIALTRCRGFAGMRSNLLVELRRPRAVELSIVSTLQQRPFRRRAAKREAA